MNRCVTIATIYFCLLTSIYSDSIKSFDNEQAWQTYILKMTPKEYSEMKNLTREEAKEKFKTEEDLKKHMEKWGRRGRFFIPLKVVDETGAAVSDVTVDVTKLIGGFFKTNYEYLRSEKQRGFLVIETNGCETVTVRLSPEGNAYYPRVKERTFYLNYPQRCSIRKGDTILVNTISIGFRKMGELLNLQKIENISFAINEKTNMSNSFSLQSLKMEDEIKNNSDPHFTVIYKRDSNGEILRKQYPPTSYDYPIDSLGNFIRELKIKTNTPYQFTGFEQAEFVLISKNPEDGVIPYDDRMVPIIPTEPVAPLNGYKKGFVMPFTSSSYRCPFFFRVGGRYGKGIIEYNRHGKHCITELYINNKTEPEKKRNLWTKEEPCL